MSPNDRNQQDNSDETETGGESGDQIGGKSAEQDSSQPPTQEEIRQLRSRAARLVGETYDADVILYSANIHPDYVDRLVDEVCFADRSETVILSLATMGGNPHAAYRLARLLQQQYERFVLLLCGKCKSAGTLIALGADSIIMGPHGQLGPLDMQTIKEDEIYLQSSVLDIRQALDAIGGYSFRFFETFLLRIVASSRGSITTQTASEIASDMASSLMEPISSQIDPLRLGEDERMMMIASEYGGRLAPQREDAIAQLIQDYPSHGFVIDVEEAKDIFGDDIVFSFSELEEEGERAPVRMFDAMWQPEARNESKPPVVEYVYPSDQSESESSHVSEQSGSEPEAAPETVSKDVQPDSRVQDTEGDRKGADIPSEGEESEQSVNSEGGS
jgi:hypothetical protein